MDSAEPEAGGKSPIDVGFLERLTRVPPAEARALLGDYLKRAVADFLGYGTPDEIEDRDRFIDLGFDSLQAVDFKDALERDLLLSLRTTLLFDYATPEALVEHLAGELALPALAGDGTHSTESSPEGEPEGAPVSESSGPARYQHLSRDELLLLLARQDAKVGAIEEARAEPIAIVGIGCRFPGGVHTPDEFWQLLERGGDAIEEIPAERWSIDELYDPDRDAPGKINTRYGGFIRGFEEFDPQFFGISPREAIELDPQQRLLLEISWEALEHAGQNPRELFGSRTGVFVGMKESEYARTQSGVHLEEIGTYYATGNAQSTAAGRIAFTLGLRGPCFTTDTACSSSMVAFHLATQSIRRGECDMALTGGVAVNLDPAAFVAMSNGGYLAPDGRCKTFDASGDGYVRGEGCAFVFLKRLSRAQADGDRILALVRGTAINQDGASGGLTVPNGPAQEDVIRAALQDAQLHPYQVGYIEAHGTGTSLGDPIEIGALDAVFGDSRLHDAPLVVGSVKTNIGHLEPAAGISGVIKVVLSFVHERIPPHLHLKNPNPHIDWEASVAKVPVDGIDWPRDAAVERIAGASSFGFSGTNAHVILSEAPPAGASHEANGQRSFELLPISATSSGALVAQVERYWEHLTASSEAPGGPSSADSHWRNLCHTACVGRTHLRQRAAFMAEDSAALLSNMRLWLDRAQTEGAPPNAPARTPKVAFLFTGQGSQYAGMGRDLYESSPTFRRELDACAAALEPHLEHPLLSLLWGSHSEQIDRTEYTQPALFALGYCLARLWQSWGIEPARVAGHSVGEYAAACLAGVFSLEDAAKLIAARGRLMKERTARGAMIVVFEQLERLERRLVQHEKRVSVAAINTPGNVTLSGEPQAIEELSTALEADGVRVEQLPVSRAFHSALMEPMLDEFARIASEVDYRRPTIGFLSCLDPGPVSSELASPEYWVRHVREPVRFEDAVRALDAAGCEVMLEIGPAPHLTSMARAVLEARRTVELAGGQLSDLARSYLPSLRRAQAPWRTIMSSLAELYRLGLEIDWHGVQSGFERSKTTLPPYAFQRQRMWLHRWYEPGAMVAVAAGQELHPILGRALESISLDADEYVFEAWLSATTPAILGEHRVFEVVVVPGAAFLDCALTAAVHAFGTGAVQLSDVTFPAALTLDDSARQSQLWLRPTDGGHHEFRLCSRDSTTQADSHDSASNEWIVHCQGRAARAAVDPGATDQQVALDELRTRCKREIDIEWLYETIHSFGLGFGPSFASMREVWRNGDEALARIRLPDETQGVEQAQLFAPLLDCCFQAAAGILADRIRDRTYLPLGVDQLRLWAPAGREVWCHVLTRTALPAEGWITEAVILFDLVLYRPDGQCIASIDGLRVVPATPASLLRSDAALERLLYQQNWIRKPLEGVSERELTRARYVVVDCLGDLGAAFSAELELRGQSAHHLTWPAKDAAGETSGDQQVEQQLHAQLVSDERQAGELAALVVCWDPEPREPAAGLSAAQAAGTALDQLRRIVRIQGQAAATRARLWIVTRAARRVLDGDAPQLGLTPIAGFAAALALERLDSQPSCLDLDRLPGAAEASLAVDQLLAGEREPLLAIRDGRRYAARLRRAPRSSSVQAIPAGEAYEVVQSEPGRIDRLALQACERVEPARDEVELEVCAVGLNWKDVLRARDEVPGKASGFGMECAGRIARLGAGVSNWQVGQLVVGAPAAALRSHLCLPASELVSLPDSWSAEDAAALPVAWATAHHALERLAQLAANERVLLLSAAGGVGQAAVGIAQRLGAEVHGAAGRPKWSALRALGVAQVYDSRADSLASQVRAGSAPDGVEVVFGAIGDEGLADCLACLAPGGRLVDIGSPQASASRQAFLERVAALRPDVRAWRFDLAEELPSSDAAGVSTDRESAGSDLRATFAQRLLQNEVDRIPTRVFGVRDLREAFMTLASARHVGKVVLRMQPAQQEPALVRSDRSYLISGGLGALGLEVARWLAGAGAGELLLVSRSAASDTALAAIEEITTGGCEVRVIAGDVSRAEDVRRIVSQIDGLRPLGGVVHAAGVLIDGLAESVEEETLRQVLAPKITGACNLHTATLDAPLDFFVCFSSIAALIGSAGQSAYAAANAFLDGFAQWRRARGLPGTSIAWGPWDAAGMAAALAPEQRARLSERGLRFLDPSECLRALERAVRDAHTHVGVMGVRWERYLSALPGGTPPLLASFESQEAQPTRARAIRAELEAKQPDERATLLTEFLRAELAQVMDFGSPDQIDPEAQLVELGIDSLIAVNLRHRLEPALECELPSTVLFDYPTIHELTAFLLSEALHFEGGEAELEAAIDDELLDEIESLSDEEVQRLLTESSPE